QVGKGERLEETLLQRILLRRLLQQADEVVVDELTDLPLREPLGGGIDGENPSQPLARLLTRPGQHHMLARLQLPSVEEAYGTAREKQVTAAEHLVEKGLSGPGALDQPRPVAHHRLKDAQPAASREN